MKNRSTVRQFLKFVTYKLDITIDLLRDKLGTISCLHEEGHDPDFHLAVMVRSIAPEVLAARAFKPLLT
jgi:hypothetical protein